MPRGTPTLTRNQILDAALTLIDERGADTLTMRDLARQLGVGTMSLYYHLPDKQALLAAISERVLGDVTLPAAGSWPERLRDVAHQLRAAERRHPDLVALVFTRHATAPDALRPLDYLLGTLRDAGLPPGEALLAFRALIALIAGSALGDPERHAAASGGETRSDVAQRFAQLSAANFPHLVEAARETVRLGSAEADHAFTYGLDLLVTGLQARLSNTPARHP